LTFFGDASSLENVNSDPPQIGKPATNAGSDRK